MSTIRNRLATGGPRYRRLSPTARQAGSSPDAWRPAGTPAQGHVTPAHAARALAHRLTLLAHRLTLLPRPLRRAAGLLSVLAVTAACTGGPSGPAASSRTAHRQAPRQPMVLQATWAPYQLPWAISGAVAVPDGRRLLIAGGTPGPGAEAGAVTRLNPVTGQEGRAGTLALPVTDAAAALVDDRLLLFGGRGRQLNPGSRPAAAVQPAGAGSSNPARDPGRTPPASRRSFPPARGPQHGTWPACPRPRPAWPR